MTKAIDLVAEDVSRIIEMAWEDRTTFDAIELQFGINESRVIEIMQTNLKPSSFRLWRKRVSGRNTKHAAKSDIQNPRHRCPTQGKHRRK